MREFDIQIADTDEDWSEEPSLRALQTSPKPPPQGWADPSEDGPAGPLSRDVD